MNLGLFYNFIVVMVGSLKTMTKRNPHDILKVLGNLLHWNFQFKVTNE